MRILVCVKQVADPESVLQISDESGWFKQNLIAYRINRYDEYALEEALLIKESYSGITVDAISVGPKRVSRLIKKAMEKGADRGIHIDIDHDGYLPAFRVASLIAEYAQSQYDLILAGVMSEDNMQCQVGPALASMLSYPCAVSIMKQTMDIEAKTVTVECELEGGAYERVKLPLPALLTIQSGINRPRYPSLSNVLRAQKQEILTISGYITEPDHSKEPMVGISYPEKKTHGVILQGTSEEKAIKLRKILREKSLL